MAAASTRHLNAQAALHLFVHCAKGRQSSVVSANPLKIGANQRGAIGRANGSRNGAAMDIFLVKESGPNRSSKGLPMTQAMSQFLLGYLPLVVFIGVSAVIGLVLLTVAFLVAYKQPDPEKLSAYECGFNAFDDARMKFDVRFYLVAILFIIFDLEVSFLFPWAAAFGQLGVYGFWSMMLFLAVLTIGFIYEWKKGALEWD
jgi:NADH-quinone oxidoreductase subunit A